MKTAKVLAISETYRLNGNNTRYDPVMATADFFTEVLEDSRYLICFLGWDQKVMGGKACIRGMRVTVSLVVNLVANGMNTEEIIEAYPYLQPDDIRQA